MQVPKGKRCSNSESLMQIVLSSTHYWTPQVVPRVMNSPVFRVYALTKNPMNILFSYYLALSSGRSSPCEAEMLRTAPAEAWC